MQEEQLVGRSDLEPRRGTVLPSVPRAETTETTVTPREVVRAVFKRWRVIAWFVVGVMLVTVIGLLNSEPQYRVTARVLVKKGRAEIPLAPRESSQLIISQVSEEDLNTEMQILASREVVEAALEGLPPRETEAATGWWAETRARTGELLDDLLQREEMPEIDRMVLQVGRELEVATIERSNMIEVGYTSVDPAWATQLVSALTESYIERRSTIFQSSEALPFFEEQMLAAGQRLTEAEDELQQRVGDAGVTLLRGHADPLATQKELMLRNLVHLEDELVNSEILLREMEGRVETLRARLATESERLPSSSNQNQNEAVEKVERVLVDLRLERDALSQSFAPGSRRIRDIDEQIRLAEEHLATAEARAGGINRTEINPVYWEGKSDLLSAEADFQGARDRYLSLRRQLEAYRAVVADLNRRSLDLERLSREVGLAEEAYVLYKKKHEEARISAAMDAQRLVNVTVAQPARPPLETEGPGRATQLMLALLVAVIGGAVLAFLLERFDQTYSSGEDLERLSGITHLASVPEDRQGRSA